MKIINRIIGKLKESLTNALTNSVYLKQGEPIMEMPQGEIAYDLVEQALEDRYRNDHIITTYLRDCFEDDNDVSKVFSQIVNDGSVYEFVLYLCNWHQNIKKENHDKAIQVAKEVAKEIKKSKFPLPEIGENGYDGVMVTLRQLIAVSNACWQAIHELTC